MKVNTISKVKESMLPLEQEELKFLLIIACTCLKLLMNVILPEHALSHRLFARSAEYLYSQ